jgi:2-amino-4-hydroxy-6-hydroxymethyldihydropteridine diphosphokinase
LIKSMDNLAQSQREALNGSAAVAAYVGLGSNLGASAQILAAALQALGDEPQTRVSRCSSFYRSAPVDAQGPDFINAVALLETTLSPLELLQSLQDVEAQFGRQRPYLNAPRTLDLDLLCYGQTVMQTPRLTLPHPRMHERAFVLLPLSELDAAFVIPGLGPLAYFCQKVSDQRLEKLIARPLSL